MMSNNKEGMYRPIHPDGRLRVDPSRGNRGRNLVFHQLDEHGNPEDVVACVQDVIYTPWLGFNIFSVWKVGHKTYCSVNLTGTQAGKLRFIRGAANVSLFRLPRRGLPRPTDTPRAITPRAITPIPPLHGYHACVCIYIYPGCHAIV